MTGFKVFLTSLAIVCIIATSGCLEETQYESEVGGVIENTINTTLNKIKANLSDPISIDSKTFDFGEGESISGSFNVSSVKINGVKDFVAKEIEFDVATEKIHMKIALNELVTHFKYWGDMVILNLVPLYGRGRMSVSIDQIELTIQATPTSKEGPQIRDIGLLFSLGEATFDLNGLIDNTEYSALISAILNDNFANFVNSNAELISETISPIVETIINSFLDPESGEVRVERAEVHMQSPE